MRSSVDRRIRIGPHLGTCGPDFGVATVGREVNDPSWFMVTRTTPMPHRARYTKDSTRPPGAHSSAAQWLMRRSISP